MDYPGGTASRPVVNVSEDDAIAIAREEKLVREEEQFSNNPLFRESIDDVKDAIDANAASQAATRAERPKSTPSLLQRVLRPFSSQQAPQSQTSLQTAEKHNIDYPSTFQLSSSSPTGQTTVESSEKNGAGEMFPGVQYRAGKTVTLDIPATRVEVPADILRDIHASSSGVVPDQQTLVLNKEKNAATEAVHSPSLLTKMKDLKDKLWKGADEVTSEVLNADTMYHPHSHDPNTDRSCWHEHESEAKGKTNYKEIP